LAAQVSQPTGAAARIQPDASFEQIILVYVEDGLAGRIA
jgi:hypothetical protein